MYRSPRAMANLCFRGAMVLLVLAPGPARPGDGGTQEGQPLLWENRFDNGPHDLPAGDAMAVAQDRVFVAGSTSDVLDLLVRAHDARTGDPLWDDRFDLAAGRDQALGITAAGGRVFASGIATNAADISVPVIRTYDGRTGEVLWQDLAAAPQGLFDSAAVEGHRVFAIGVISEVIDPEPGMSFLFPADSLVRAYDSRTGELLWQDRFGAPDPPFAVQLDRPVTVKAGGGRVFVGGRIRPGPGPSRWFVRAYDAGTGELLWQDTTTLPGQANELALDGGRLVAAGRINRPSGPFLSQQDWLIRAYDAATGALLWEDLVDKGPSPVETARDVTTADARVFVAGIAGATCNSFVVHPDNCDALIRTYDLATGQFLWEDRFDEAPLDEFNSVAARDGRVVAVGEGTKDCALNEAPTDCDGLIRRYDAGSGQLLFDGRVDLAGTDDVLNGVTLHGGRVFTSGAVTDGSLAFVTDLVLRAYAMGEDED
jgi:outer membrane protein assembly factor BamB